MQLPSFPRVLRDPRKLYVSSTSSRAASDLSSSSPAGVPTSSSMSSSNSAVAVGSGAPVSNGDSLPSPPVLSASVVCSRSLSKSSKSLSPPSSTPSAVATGALSPSPVTASIRSLFRKATAVVEVIPDKFYWVACSETPKMSVHDRVHVFSTDRELVYDPFYADFGPLNLGQAYRYTQKMTLQLKNPKFKNAAIVHRCSPDDTYRPNSAFLIGAYMMIKHDKSPEEAWKPFESVRPPFLAYRDATYGICTYRLSVLDCLKGLHFAMKLGWFDFETFNIAEYEFYEKVEHGDLNWIIPKKFIAFSGPCAQNSSPENRDPRCYTIPLENYAPAFKKLGVRLVVRLNKRQYTRKIFTNQGINHFDLYFLDGSCPPLEIIDKFLDVCEKEPGAVAVHCKAGLGRTGTLIGCYAMKHYKFPPAAWIGWNRICRPGSVLGPQQYFMHEIQSALSVLGRPLKHPVDSASSSLPSSSDLADTPSTADPNDPLLLSGGMSPEERRAARHGDYNQGERLMSAKRKIGATPMAGGSAGTPLVATSSFFLSQGSGGAPNATLSSVSSSLGESDDLKN